MKWILILIVSTSNGIAIDHIQFNTEAACEYAKEWAQLGQPRHHLVSANCFPETK